jgi:beta-xylosidase
MPPPGPFPASWSAIEFPWLPDRADGTYQNPILCADYSDPDVIAAGEEFFLVASSFNCTPALPILRSPDLVNWTIVNHAVKNLPEERYRQVQSGCGVWAPAIRQHAGRFWIFFPMPDEGIFVTTAEHPCGAWSPPWLLHAGKGLIDPCPLWDDDGRAYLVHAYARSRSGIKHRLRVCPMAPDASRLLGEGQIVFDDPQRHPTLEGPKFYKRDGYYYILAPAGGVATGWQVALRSRNVFGPYEDRIVLQQGKTPINGPHQGALVSDRAGQDWFVHFQEVLPYGRIVHLQPVIWRDGWPIIGNAGEPVRLHAKPAGISAKSAPQSTDEFDAPSLGLQWQWQANHSDDWYRLDARPGWLRLVAQAAPDGLALAPHVLLQKFPARSFSVQASLDISGLGNDDRAGLIVMGKEYATLAVRRSAGAAHICYISNDRQVDIASLSAMQIDLYLNVADGGRCKFGYATAGQARRDTPQEFQAVAGEWIGAKVGIFAAGSGANSGWADFDFFRFGPADNPERGTK